MRCVSWCSVGGAARGMMGRRVMPHGSMRRHCLHRRSGWRCRGARHKRDSCPEIVEPARDGVEGARHDGLVIGHLGGIDVDDVDSLGDLHNPSLERPDQAGDPGLEQARHVATRLINELDQNRSHRRVQVVRHGDAGGGGQSLVVSTWLHRCLNLGLLKCNACRRGVGAGLPQRLWGHAVGMTARWRQRGHAKKRRRVSPQRAGAQQPM